MLSATPVFGSWLGDSARGVADAADTFDKIVNRYFHAVLVLWPAMLFGVAKLRAGERLSPKMSTATSFTMFLINVVCVIFLIIHWSPETSTIFDWIYGIIERIFG